MSNALPAKTCELHVHIGGCLTAEDLFELGRDHADAIDWTLFVDSFEEAYGERPDPPSIYRRGAANALRPYCVYSVADGGDFARFQAKFNFSICVFRYWWHVLAQHDELVARIVERHQREGLRYVEYRAMAPFGADNPEAFMDFHATMARSVDCASSPGFTARYLVSLPRWQPLETYRATRRLLDEQPELNDVIVGLDLCHFEEGYPPASTGAFFSALHEDNAAQPERHLDVAYHVGEVYFDKSLESAVRWCHEVAELGAVRLGHCIALGLDPAVATARRPHAHVCESAAERLAQIDYDLRHVDALRNRGIGVDVDALVAEQRHLCAGPDDARCERSYTPARLEEIRLRQTWVLDCLTESAIPIETCPTSNLRIGAVPSPEDHPVHRFLRSDVPLIIGADDPGLFDCALADEVDWVIRHGRLDATELSSRLGDPLRFRCAGQRSG